MTDRPNMELQEPSRRRLKSGDIFSILYPSRGYIFGRVMLTDLPSERAPLPGCSMVYIYDAISATQHPDIAELKTDGLLIPPVFINRLPWSRGYFRTVTHEPLDPSQFLAGHCFYDVVKGRYVDLDGNPLDGRMEPCGDWALHSYRSVDDLISDALGIGRAPTAE